METVFKIILIQQAITKKLLCCIIDKRKYFLEKIHKTLYYFVNFYNKVNILLTNKLFSKLML